MVMEGAGPHPPSVSPLPSPTIEEQITSARSAGVVARTRRLGGVAYDRGLSALSAVSHRGYSADNTLLVLGTPRSGTTFLQETIAVAPRTYPVFEPMSPYHDARVGALGYPGGFVAVAPGSRHDELRDVLDQILRGRRLTRWSTRLRKLKGLASADHFVVKEVKLTRSVGWMAETFSSTRMVVIVRHPCAVVASMLHARGRWGTWTADEVAQRLRGGYEDLAGRLLHDEQPQVVRLAAFWAAETSDVLDQTTAATAMIVTYEELLDEPMPTLNRVFAYLGLETPAGLERAIDQPSAMSTPLSAIRSGDDPLRAWQKRIEPSDRERILETVHAFGIDAYSADPMPDVSRLLDRQRTT
jgi:hypothetical protein